VSVFPSNYYAWWRSAFLEVTEHLPANEKQWMNSFSCFACTYSFWFTYETVFMSAHEFSHFYLSDSLPRLTVGGVSWKPCRAELPTAVKPWHRSQTFSFTYIIYHFNIAEIYKLAKNSIFEDTYKIRNTLL